MNRSSVAATFAFFVLIVSATAPFAELAHEQRARITATGPGYWGSCESFANVSIGTDSPSVFNGLTLGPFLGTDTVVLDGFLYLMTRQNMVGTVATYAPLDPPGKTNDWNMSVEITRPREGSAYMSPNITEAAGEQALVVYLTDPAGTILAGVKLVTGNPANEAILAFDATASSWEMISNDLRPAFPHRLTDYSLKPDRYIVSFGHGDLSAEVRVIVTNTATGIVLVRSLPLPSTLGIDHPQLRFDIDMTTGKVSAYNVASGWMLDNLMFRSLLSRYPVIGPATEVVTKELPLWVQVADERGGVVEDAAVRINGTLAPYDPADERYEALVPRGVDWDVPISYSVVSDGVAVYDTLRVTTAIGEVNRLTIPKWWNGWDWVTVFGRDDSYSPTAAQQTYSGFAHPATNYISSTFSGNSTELLATQSEIAIHYPHDYAQWGHKTWSEAVNSSDLWSLTFGSKYWFASRWDDPRYVGDGDTFITIACPGNSASWEQVYAEFLAGVRIMGISAQYYLGGNSSLLGSYWLTGPNLTSIPDWTSWDPVTRMDMMDMFRAISTDKVSPDQWVIARTIAGAAGVLRLYNHGTIAEREFLAWMCDTKTNLTYENWKATDGEVASYVYGRSSVDASYRTDSEPDLWTFDVSRRDPTASGYWRVPVTLAIDISDKGLDDIEVTTGSTVLKMSDGSLRNITGARIMDAGYDIRGDTLYVSQFWNESSILRVKVHGLFNPRILETPTESGLAYEDFRAWVNATPADNGTNSWTVATAPNWLSVLDTNETSLLLGGFPTVPGKYLVSVTVNDINTTSRLSWYVTISRIKTISGFVLGPGGFPLDNGIVMISFKEGDYIRSIEYAGTDINGFYSLSFDAELWVPGDKVEVSASFENVTTANASIATNFPYQEIDLSLREKSSDSWVLLVVVVWAAIAAAIVSVAIISLRRKKKKKAEVSEQAPSQHP